VSFDNSKRQTIATAIRYKEKKDSVKGEPPHGSTNQVYFNYLKQTLSGYAVREAQSIGDCDEEKMINACSRTANDLLQSQFSTSLATQRGLQSLFPRTTTVELRGEGGTTQPVSLSRAKEVLGGNQSRKKQSTNSSSSNNNFVPPRQTLLPIAMVAMSLLCPLLQTQAPVPIGMACKVVLCGRATLMLMLEALFPLLQLHLTQ